MAGGLTAAEFGSGAIILAPVAKTLIKSFGISSTFKIMGIGLMLLIVIASFIIQEAPLLENKTANFTDSINDKK